MALQMADGFDAANGPSGVDDLQIFTIEPVELQFSVAANFVAGQVANNVIVLAISNGRILRIDLNHPEDIDDIDLPKKVSDIGVIRRMFLDPTASHLIVCTARGENYYLHSDSKDPRPLARLRGVTIESVAWNPSHPTSTTNEILIGAADGNIYEAYLDLTHRRDVIKHLKTLRRISDDPVTGLWVDNPQGGRSDYRRIIIGTPTRLFYLIGQVGFSHDGSGSVYTKLFDGERPVEYPEDHDVSRLSPDAAMSIAVSPNPPDSSARYRGNIERAYAWLSSQGVLHGKLSHAPNDAKPNANLIKRVVSESKMIPRSQIAKSESKSKRQPTSESIDAIALTQWHIISLIGDRVVTTNRLTGETVSEHRVLLQGQKPLGFSVDLQENTLWLFTSSGIYEIVVRDEERNIWKILMKMNQFESALEHAKDQPQKETIAAAFGDHLASQGHWGQAATLYGRSNKPFEDVALSIIDNDKPDALRQFLLTKLAATKKGAVMQRIMIASWLVEVFMTKLNSLDDTIITEAGLSDELSPKKSRQLLNSVRREYQDFISKYKHDLDKQTAYDVIGSHGREEELLYFANAVDDFDFVLSYWVQRERWAEALDVLKRQSDAEVFYRYGSVLMTHVPQDLVDILMRHQDLNPRKLIPAMLDYNRTCGNGSLSQNQALRYLNYTIYRLLSKDAAVHNTLVSIYASHPSKDEADLLAYLQSQGEEPRYDPDFALRLCIQHHRTLSCVHIYTSMGQYLQAVDLALSHDETELAAVIADRPMERPQLRKRLWLAIARKVISRSDGIKTAIEFLKRCELLKIEDLIPFFPDFVVIDDFKEEICGALEDYSRNIDALKKEMDESTQTATNIKVDIAALDHRYAIVEPGEKCYTCNLPLLSRQFFVFPCQHAFHSDCLGRKILEQSGTTTSSRIKELQMQIHRGLVSGPKREAVVAELDSLVASACILCSDFAIKRIDEPFISRNDNARAWDL